MEQNGYQFLDRIAYHDYEGIALDEDEQARLLADLGDCDAMILRNHGLLACGPNIGQAFRRIYYLEMACKIQLDVMASGTCASRRRRCRSTPPPSGKAASPATAAQTTRPWNGPPCCA